MSSILDYIKRSSVELRFMSLYHETYTDDQILKILYDIPAADVKPVIHARWIECGDNQPMSCDKVYCCSNCGKGRKLFNFTPFCAECGADMENWGELE